MHQLVSGRVGLVPAVEVHQPPDAVAADVGDDLTTVRDCPLEEFQGALPVPGEFQRLARADEERGDGDLVVWVWLFGPGLVVGRRGPVALRATGDLLESLCDVLVGQRSSRHVADPTRRASAAG